MASRLDDLLTLHTVDAEMVQDSCRFKMELAPALQRTVHGEVKPSTYSFASSEAISLYLPTSVITQCEIRKLYARKNEPGVSEAIEVAKSCERRRCGHHPDEFPEPLSTVECFQSVVDPKDSGENKHRYVVASQSQDLRRMLRGVRGVPLIYIKRSVMILEPMSDESARLRAREERSKFRAGLKPMAGKRKRDDKDDDEDGDVVANGKGTESKAPEKKKSKRPGPKGPNPLSMKKKSKKDGEEASTAKKVAKTEEKPAEEPAKRKRKRKAKSTGAGGEEGEDSAPAVSNGDES